MKDLNMFLTCFQGILPSPVNHLTERWQHFPFLSFDHLNALRIFVQDPVSSNTGFWEKGKKICSSWTVFSDQVFIQSAG